MANIEKYDLNGMCFLYFDLSDSKSNDDYIKLIKDAKEIISHASPNSVYTITNVRNLSFDSNTKEIAAEWVTSNQPYVIYAAIIGADGIKKIMLNAVFKMSGRKNLRYFNTKQEAEEWLVCQ